MADFDDARAEEIKALARDHAEDAITALADVMNDPGEKGAARVAAAKTLLERGFGAAERRVEQRVDHHIHDHRAAHLGALQKLAARQAQIEPPREHVSEAEFTEVERNGR